MKRISLDKADEKEGCEKMMKKRRQLPPRLSLSAGFTWMGRVIWKREKKECQRG